MTEELLVTGRDNALIDPGLHIWTWEVAMYLFLGGLTAGIMIFAALMTVRSKDKVAPFATARLALLAPIALSLGMGRRLSRIITPANRCPGPAGGVC